MTVTAPRASRRRSTRVTIPAPATPVVRCAIYTRKSTSEGLDSDFSSLDAQREACEAYIKSQKHDGWQLVGESYDDGGFSGRNNNRPALERLMQNIEAGLVDCVVVYKTDRISRSLHDFSDLIRVFNRHNVIFVSVTQHFNTGTSSGRLMLNLLLSFAEFERELIIERTSDKMRAARKLGKWVGGPPVLGYDLDRQAKKLIVSPEEAEMVRELFDLYLEHRSLMKVAREVNRRGWTTKSWVTVEGKHRSGGKFDKTKLQRILTNVTYLGKTQHQGEVFEGEHDGIVDPDIFEQVQRVIKDNGNGNGSTVRNKHGALLKGILRCGECDQAMAHTYTKKGNKLYRYYVCTTYQKQGPDACSTRSLPAQEIEDFVVEQIKRIGQDPELQDQVFAEAVKQQNQQRQRLKKEYKRLQKERQQKGEEIKRLVGAIGGSSAPSPSLTKRLSEVEGIVESLDQRLLELRALLAEQNTQNVIHADVRDTLREFLPVWGQLTSIKRVNLFNMVLQNITYQSKTGAVELSFRSFVSQN